MKASMYGYKKHGKAFEGGAREEAKQQWKEARKNYPTRLQSMFKRADGAQGAGFMNFMKKGEGGGDFMQSYERNGDWSGGSGSGLIDQAAQVANEKIGQLLDSERSRRYKGKVYRNGKYADGLVQGIEQGVDTLIGAGEMYEKNAKIARPNLIDPATGQNVRAPRMKGSGFRSFVNASRKVHETLKPSALMGKDKDKTDSQSKSEHPNDPTKYKVDPNQQVNKPTFTDKELGIETGTEVDTSKLTGFNPWNRMGKKPKFFRRGKWC